MKSAIVFFLLLFFVGYLSIVPTALRAAENQNTTALVDELYNKCGEEMGVPAAIADCVLKKEREYGSLLTRAYEKAIVLAGNDAPLLRDSQRSWLQYQSSNCRFHRKRWSFEGPNIGYAISARCLLRTTLQRLEELRNLAEQ